MGGAGSFEQKKYGQNILGARKAIPAILKLFSEFETAATWATVGFLFCENKEELLDILPKEVFRPKYHNSSLSNYNYIDELGNNEIDDPYYYGLSLIKNISETPKQEIATHTLSHYYCLEAGQDIASFEIDLANAIKIANRKKYEIKSIVFPRNQYDQQNIDVNSP